VVAKEYSWNLAFGFAAIVMTISLITFLFTKKTLGPIGLAPASSGKRAWHDYAVYFGSLCVIPLIMIMVSHTEYTDWFMYIIGPCTLLYLFYEMRNFSSAENKKLIAALVFVIFSILFWAFFEQSGGSLSLFAASHLNDHVLGIKLDPNGVNNSSNSFFVIVFASLLGMLWLWMSKRKIEPNTIIKFGLGFLFLAGGFYIFYYTKFFADANGVTSLGFFTFGWFIITFGELCLSPIGMSIMTKLSPQRLQGVMMGMWFLASAYGQYVAGILGAGMSATNENATLTEKLIAYTDGYKQLAIYALIAGVVMIVISPFVRKLMQEVK
jgi:POT family proton-dependent oligopeptide transporter